MRPSTTSAEQAIGTDMIGNYNYGTGRRKSSVARVFIKRGKRCDRHQRPLDRRIFSARNGPHDCAPAAGADQSHCARFDVQINVHGGGESGQAGAVRHGIARALIDYDETLKPALSGAGLVTRDAREVERKKVGFRKARRRKQFSKR